jgi:hypothetical protein
MPSWLLMSVSQKDALIALGTSDELAPRAITNSILAGLWACPLSLLDDPKYAEWAQGLSYLPLRTLSAEALFS